MLDQICSRKGQIAVLVDPEKCADLHELKEFIRKAEFAGVDYFFVGGSTVTREEFTSTVHFIKENSQIPLVIFPGSAHQISAEADAILYLSLISGRNPDYLIGHHVTSANELFEMDIEVIPTGYILVDGGTRSSVAYVSQTTPIPSDKGSIIVSTAKAGILQGKKITYLDAGSGAAQHVPAKVIRSLSQLSTPIIVGGGIRTREQLESLSNSGANVVVIGNKLEEDIEFLLEIQDFIRQRP
ncbi:MAG: phosphoglycerol geranylgeranyltransferase [Bacteroidetes bacterium RIFCSPHIGHO2_02_FULL_44_7]|nr:MAG: phosphoglycerol geranylgeranyltransferase [Bacteroidetes bacterium RIFCSPHIGHO2_02_FULL_44_7]